MNASALVVGAVFGLVLPILLLRYGLRALSLARLLGTSQRPVQDGRVALSGRLQAREVPLQTPFFDRAAVSYRYSVAHRVVGSKQVGPVYAEEAQGFVQTPTLLRSPLFEVAILAGLHSPEPDRFVEAEEAGLADRLRALLGRLEPAVASTPPIVSNGALLDAPTGALRHEVTTRGMQPLDAKIRRYVSETSLGEGEEVALIGTYRARENALVSIDEILPPDASAARSRLRGRALRAFVVASASAVFGAFMALLLSAPK